MSEFKGHGFGILIVAITNLFWIVPTLMTDAGAPLNTEQFVHIYAEFRHPHHLIPSSWGTIDYILLGMFVLVIGVSLFEIWRQGGDDDRARQHKAIALVLACIFGIILGGFVCGYVFVEVLPTRLFVVAQPFRLVVFLTWLGWILVAYSISHTLGNREWGLGILFMASVVSVPALTLCRALSIMTYSQRGINSGRRVVVYVITAVLVVACVLLTIESAGSFSDTSRLRTLFLIVVGFVVALAVSISMWSARVALTGLGLVLILVLSTFGLDRTETLPEIPLISSYISEGRPVFTLDEAIERDGEHDDVKLAISANLETESDALILIPWSWTRWRLYSERAVVVDWKFFIFNEDGMEEWYDRYLEIYERAGYPYKVSKGELTDLREKYGFQYAVLPVSKDFGLPIVKTTKTMMLVRTDGVGEGGNRTFLD